MVAVTTDPIPWSAPRSGRSSAIDDGRVTAAPTGPAVPVGAAQRLLLVLVGLALVVGVAVGTAALGRVLDTHRGIPAATAVR